jgi:hypothetical protein
MGGLAHYRLLSIWSIIFDIFRSFRYSFLFSLPVAVMLLSDNV